MKEPKKEDIKELIINGNIYAKYRIFANILFVQLSELGRLKIAEKNVIHIICMVEDKHFLFASFLNIPKF